MTANGEMGPLESIIADTTDEMFQVAGGFAFTDEIAWKLSAKWRKQANGPVVVSAIDLAWLLDGYARSRLSHNGGTGT
jgi:hypothetical protein